MNYDLELEKAVSEIKNANARTVCIQLPDGLKPKAGEIADFLKENTDAELTIWMGSCFGACDVPELDVDLLIQWGHNEFQWKRQELND